MPKSINIREANGGFIVSKHGGNDDSFSGQDHVAKNFNHAVRLAKEHMGGGSTDATPGGDAEGSGDMGEAEGAESKKEVKSEGDGDMPEGKAPKKVAAKDQKNPAPKKRAFSETY